MGLFDEIVCRYPLPGTKPEFVEEGHLFQTKDLGCDMSTYEITEDGRLVGWSEDYTGELDFYSSNVAGGGSGFQFTSNGEDAEWVNYVAKFVQGKIVSIEQVSYTRSIVLSSDEWEHRQNEPGCPNYKLPSPLLGHEVFVVWGGSTVEDGYSAKCVAETSRDICLEKSDGELETIQKALIRNIVFPNRDIAKACEDWEDNSETVVRQRMKAKLDAKRAARTEAERRSKDA